ncbi:MULTISPECIES: Lrp/AsnC family transcriptional regulator [Alteromonadaceae]|uniref:Lrp/AsnC family transcriptional regulator n=1 Tax=Alteromonadaceae TaxID=72275 RepID=UPI0026E2C974|nr:MULTISPECIES: Lrp/AsnC family transcriptional regulator [unclassified Aliiglaciecola]MDO6711484.1 Lrp/AsnC family transcriptional regulator [Aliiglaciecola sp. 2_MG-2023]MDO6752539.1 Lrp/AsnC family transcriptional regulator [Aliiglaciecola sp. 1_MG-2023]
MDAIDKRILRLMQQDVTLSVSHIAEQVGLSNTPCWRRIQLLEKQGVINRRVALLNSEKVGLNVTAFVQVKAGKHDDKWLKMFAVHASNLEEVVEFYRMSGEYDYMLKVMVKDLKAFDVFYKKLVSGIDLSDVTSSFAMEQIKYTTTLPIV